MPRRSPPPFWLPALVVAGTVALAPLFRGRQPPAQAHALAFLLCGTVALSAYLWAVILHPEKF